MGARFVRGISKKTSRYYYAVEVTICDRIKKLIFLSDAEVALVNVIEGEDVFEDLDQVGCYVLVGLI